MPQSHVRLWALLVALLGLTLGQVKEARASTFEVSPIRVKLAQSSSSGLLTVHNTSSEALRFQVSAFAWSQGQRGEVQLSATNDIVFFPSMLSLKPGERRNIRVGTTAPFGAQEKTFRVFVEELPSASQGKSNSIRVLTRFGIPVFLAPASPQATPLLDKLGLIGRRLSFSLKNTGNAHFLTQHVRIRAAGADGGVIWSQDLPAWYVLAGGARDYSFDLPASACAATRLVIAVDADVRSLESSLALPAATCAP
jgi:fimbrial chaperone protein